jgi:hypothetical protein
LSDLLVAGDRAGFGGISFGLAVDPRQRLKMPGVLVGETDFGAWDLVRVPHPDLEVLALAAQEPGTPPRERVA